MSVIVTRCGIVLLVEQSVPVVYTLRCEQFGATRLGSGCNHGLRPERWIQGRSYCKEEAKHADSCATALSQIDFNTSRMNELLVLPVAK